MTSPSTAPLRLAVILGSTREGRFGPRLARWFTSEVEQHGGFEVDVVDLAEFGFPLPMGAGHAKEGGYEGAVAQFAARIASADVFVLVTPEYNHGYPAALKSALDALYAEWNAKPAAFLAYGGASGGIRAVEQLRQVLAELHVADIREAVHLPRAQWTFFDEDGDPRDASVAVAVKAMLEQLAWWGQALRAARLASPYGS